MEADFQIIVWWYRGTLGAMRAAVWRQTQRTQLGSIEAHWETLTAKRKGVEAGQGRG